MTRKPLDRRALFASGAAAALFAAAGVSAGPLPQRGGKMRLALSGASRTDDWVNGDGLFMQVARRGLVFETLTEVAADGTLRGELATSWVSSSDSKTWVFELRDGVRFHDGAIFTATDVVHSLGEVGIVTAISDTRIQIKLRNADPSLPFTLSAADYVIRPAHNLDSGIGTGLYSVNHFAAGQQVLAERVPAHWKDGQAGWFDMIELVSVPAAAVRAEAVAEYLVDGADIDDPEAFGGFDDIAVFDGHAIARRVIVPSVTGNGAFDDLRAPQRWWGA